MIDHIEIEPPKVNLRCFTRVIQGSCQVMILNVPPTSFLEIASDPIENVNSCDLQSELPAFTPLSSLASDNDH